MRAISEVATETVRVWIDLYNNLRKQEKKMKKYKLIKQHAVPWEINGKEIEVGTIITPDEITNGNIWCEIMKDYFQEVVDIEEE
jgi:hypothetical protein